jgi:hypothetical protein
MAQRVDLGNLLKDILGSSNVYFQPPPSFQLKYPCVVYQRTNIHSEHGDNIPYKLEKEYTLTFIYADPDSIIPDEIAKLPKCSFDRHFVSDNLNHDVFKILF